MPVRWSVCATILLEVEVYTKMNLVIRKLGRCPPFSHMGDLLNTCMLLIGLLECHILPENPVEFRYEPEF